MANKDDVELLTYAEVCKILAMKLGTIYSMVARNQIPHVRLGRRVVRFPLIRLREWIEQCRVPATCSPEWPIEERALHGDVRVTRAKSRRDAR